MGRQARLGLSADGRPIGVRQYGDPSLDGRVLVLVFGCIHGDECAARAIPPPRLPVRRHRHPSQARQPQPGRLAARHPAERPWGRPEPQFPRRLEADRPPGHPQFSGPRPFSEPESRLAPGSDPLAPSRGDDLVPPAGRGRSSAPGAERSRGAPLSPGSPGCRSARSPGRRAPRRTGRTTAFPGRARSSSSCHRGPRSSAGRRLVEQAAAA